MSNRGFTLVELIITIGLLALLGVLIANNMVSVQSKQLKKNYENYQKEIAAAACLGIEEKEDVATGNFFKKDYNESTLSGDITSKKECINNGECYVLTERLIALGYLNKDLLNPATGEAVTNEEVVRIRYIDGEKKCDYYSAN